jgi:hypothetical protein
LRQIQEELRGSGEEYWAVQVRILTREIMAWLDQAERKPEEAAALMRASADEEDAIEKLPVTPGPIVPCREQLGDLAAGAENHPKLALQEFEATLLVAPGRAWGRGRVRRMLPNSPVNNPNPSLTDTAGVEKNKSLKSVEIIGGALLSALFAKDQARHSHADCISGRSESVGSAGGAFRRGRAEASAR